MVLLPMRWLAGSGRCLDGWMDGEMAGCAGRVPASVFAFVAGSFCRLGPLDD